MQRGAGHETLNDLVVRWGRSCIAIVLAAQGARAQAASERVVERPIRWTAAVADGGGANGDRFDVVLSAGITAGWKLYSLTQPAGGPVATTVKVQPPHGLRGKVHAPAPEMYADRNFNISSEIYRDSVQFRVPVRLEDSSQPAAGRVGITIMFQTCTSRYCLPPRTDTVYARLHDAFPGVALDQPPPSRTLPSGPVAFEPPTDIASLLRFLWLAATMGFLALLTPCILPMIPITVAFFGAAKGRSRTRAALAHSAGTVSSFLVLGLVVSAVFGAGGVTRLAANPWLNLAIAFLFTAFALNLFGLFEITLPSSLLTRITRASEGPRTGAALLMGAVFAITSFTCTAPFVGTLLVLATQGSWSWPLLGLTVYAMAFATPFLAIALSPALVAALPKPGAWLLTVKRALGVLELAMAVKFISNADLVMHTGLLPRTSVLVLWICACIGVAIVCSLILREQASVAIKWAFLTVGAAALIGAVSLGRGLAGRPLGEIEAYLPPRLATATARLVSADGLSWHLNDLAGGIEEARRSGKPVFVDFTGYTCTNCRWMEANMFPLAEVHAALGQYVRVRLFTDGIGEPYAAQQLYQQRTFGTIALPYYAVLRPDSTASSTFLGMTRERAEFMTFLRQGLQSF